MPSAPLSPAAHSALRPDPSHARPATPAGRAAPDTVGALWVAALGAFLVIVGAATFVAVRWDEIPSTTKLGALVAVTASCLAAHRLLRATLPVTALVLLHLGVLLTPIDVAAVGVGLAWRWPLMLLAIGLATAAVPQVAPRRDRTVVLRLASAAGVVLVAGGLGGLTGVSAGLLLAGAALAAVLAPGLGRGAEAVAWATLAGLAVPLAGGADLGITGAGVVVDLGLAGAVPPAVSALTGLLAGVTLAVSGRRHDDVALALLGLAAVATGAATAWYRLTPEAGGPGEPELTVAALAALTLLAEVAARVWRADEFWGRVTDQVAVLGKAVAVVVTAHLAGALIEAPGTGIAVPGGALVGLLTGLTWLVAVSRRPLTWGLVPDDRPIVGATGWGYGNAAPVQAPVAGPRPPRRPPVDPVRAFGPVAAVVAAAGGVALATASAGATGLTLGVLAALLLIVDPAAAVGRRGARANGVLAAGLLAAVPAYVWSAAGAAGASGGPGRAAWAWAAAAAGAAGGLVIAACTVRALRSPDLTRDEVDGSGALFAALALAPVATGAGVVALLAGTLPAVAFAIVVLGTVAAVLDRLDAGPGRVPESLVPRLAVVVPLAASLALAPAEVAGMALLAAALLLVDAARLDEPVLLAVGGCAGTLAAAAGSLALGTSVGVAGLVVTATGVAWLGLGRSLPRRYAPPALVVAVVAATAGLVMSAADTRLLATDLLVVGGLAVAGGAVLGQRHAVVAGTGLVTGGLWLHLAAAQVAVTEPYVLPLAAFALAGGLAARRRAPELSSWATHAPAVALLGGAALAERLAGGPAWHGLVAGMVGVVAVTLGSAHRLVGPLLVGTVLVVTVSIHETLGVTARVPTWVWLCTGGLALLAAGVGMERRDLGPVDAGRRMADVLRTRYS